MKLDVKRYYQSKALFYLLCGFNIIAWEMIEVFENNAELQSIDTTYFNGITGVLLVCVALIFFFYRKKLKENHSDADVEEGNREVDEAAFYIHSRMINTIIFIAMLVSLVSPDWINSINTSTFILCLFGIELLVHGLLMAGILYYEQQEDL